MSDDDDAVRIEMIKKYGADWQQPSDLPLEERPGWKALGESRRWFVHVLGPDDVIEQADELTALREANELNKSIARKRQSGDPWGMAVVIDGNDPNARAGKPAQGS